MIHLPEGRKFLTAAMAVALAGGVAWGAAATASAQSTDDPAALIVQLGDPEYHVREAAEARLAEMGYAAYEALTQATDSDDLEIAARARYLLRLITIDWSRPDDPEPVRKAFEGYDGLGDAERLARIEALAKLPSSLSLEGLCRVVRFDRSELVAKQAALVLCRPETPSADRAARIERSLQGSTRAASKWLAAYGREATDLNAAARLWGEAAADEDRLQETRPAITGESAWKWLMRRQAVVLRRAGQREGANAAIAKIVERESGAAQSLAELVEWLVDEEAWTAVDSVAEKFADVFAADPLLGYALAQARVVAGRAEEGEELAALAAAIAPDNLDQHLQVGDQLRRRGQIRWAEKEFRQVIDRGPRGGFLSLTARRILADMLHDTLDFGRAADELEACLVAMRENIDRRHEADNAASIEEVRCRALYLRALHRAEQSDKDAQRRLLEEALAQDPSDIDVLIALAEIPDLPAALRNRVRESIERACQGFRVEQSQSPHDGTPFNQLAWLLANTGGDLDEALESSRRSLELQPDEPAYLDTLGRVHYARGEYREAIEQQQRAVELSPHSGLMRRQLDLFRAALEKQKGDAPPDEASGEGKDAAS